MSRVAVTVLVFSLVAFAFAAPDPLELTGVAFQLSAWQYADVPKSVALTQCGTWVGTPNFNLTCGGRAVGPSNPSLSCIDRVEVVLVASEESRASGYDDVAVDFVPAQLDEFRAVSLDDPDVFVYSLPLFKYTDPNVYYENGRIVWRVVAGEDKNGTLGGATFNPFNASASSLRAFYGVPLDVVGSDRVAQASSLIIGGGASGVNTSVIDQFLSLQGISAVPSFPEWAPPNSPAETPTPALKEYMLDVQTQLATAPRAITYAIPTVLPIDELERALAAGGALSGEQIQEISQAFQWAVPGDTPNENLTALIDLGDTERAAASEFYTGYLRAFAKNLTDEARTAGITPNVLSWSWNTGFYRAIGVPFHVLEDILEELTLSGGVTILVASGDNGAAATEEACLPADDPLVGNEYAAWPIISPWVTVVGGTQFLDGPDEAVSSSSTGAEGCTSGGGFAGPSYPAELYSTPAWQKKAVRRYLAENNATTFAAFPTAATPGWNPTGRAYPDISMYGAGIGLLNAEDPDDMRYSMGTSFSAPFLAAFFSLANEALLRDGYEVIGYANPMLYWMGENCTDALVDITVGSNQAGKTKYATGSECLFGFPAAPGWDAATGLGSARYEPFVSCAKRYQDEVRSKGLELLPDGSYRGSPTGGPDPDPNPPTADGHGHTASLVALVVTLASLLHY